MAIKLKDEKLTFTLKISRELHDEIDKMRDTAKKAGVVYDPSECVEKALRKDIAASAKQLAAITAEIRQRALTK